MKGGQRQPCVFVDGTVPRNKIIRRLIPKECERLQGFPDNYTQIPYRGKSADQCPIAPRYEALGNSMSVNVMEFLGKRIETVEKSL
jgi:DNA (cytosine-5)-methyltransferase 1